MAKRRFIIPASTNCSRALADDGSLEKAFIASVKHLSDENKLDLSLLHGDGSNTVAKKGAKESATAATNTRRVKR